MNKYKEHFIQTSIDGVAHIAKFVRLQKIGSLYRCICPFHHEKTPSMTIYPAGHENSDHKKQDHMTWYCFGCKKSGDVIQFHKIQNDLDSREEAVDELIEEYELKFEEDEELNALKLALQRAKEQNNIISLSDINLTCSKLGYSCKRFYQNSKYKKQVFTDINNIFKSLDKELSERSAVEAQDLIQWFNKKLSQIYSKYQMESNN